jgi:hypothetical protein
MTTSNYPFGPGFQYIYPVPVAYHPFAYTFRAPLQPDPYFWPMPDRSYPFAGTYPGYPVLPAYPTYFFSPFSGNPFDAPYPSPVPNRVEPTSKGFQVKLSPQQENSLEHMQFENVKAEHVKVENVKTENAKVEHAKAENVQAENVQAENAKVEHAKAENVKAENAKAEHAKVEHAKAESPPVKVDTGIEIGGKHGAGFHTDTQVDKHGVTNHLSSHVGAEEYGLNVQSAANLDNNTKGFQFDTEGQLGGKYGVQAHVEGHAGLNQGIGLSTEAQVGGEYGIGAHMKSQLGGGQGAAFSTGAQILGDHGLGAHAGAQVGGGQGLSLTLGGNVGSHDGQVGINLGGKEKKEKEKDV